MKPRVNRVIGEEDAARNERPFIVFLHIHKCAGLSFKRILRRQFGPSFGKRIVNRMHGVRPKPLRAALADVKGSQVYFAGHFGYGVHELLPSPVRYVTFLRDPVQRLLSLYDYSKRTPQSFYHSHATNVSFEEFVSNGDVFETDNGMTRFLIGDLARTDYYICRKPIGSLTEVDLQLAIENLERHFVTPGITERFDESLVAISDDLALPCACYLRLNESQLASQTKSSWNGKLEPFVSLDRRLFEWANRKLDEAKISQPSFEAKVEDFKLSNARHQRRYQGYYDAYQSFMNRLRS
ncbi:MAG: sulfotransferase family 2 domain-containing protein [Planctomycetales bacterium]|nr:sulfotransferase family 2 domain-containing protein [Planctomycetales bacterium]